MELKLNLGHLIALVIGFQIGYEFIYYPFSEPAKSVLIFLTLVLGVFLIQIFDKATKKEEQNWSCLETS
jgi:uncharacterized protein YacL